MYYKIRAVARHDNWGGGGGGIFIYSCLHTVKTIDFKRNPSGRTRIYEYTPPPIIVLTTALYKLMGIWLGVLIFIPQATGSELSP